MSNAVEAAPSQSKSMSWAGRVVSALPVLVLVASAIMKLSHNPTAVAGLTGKYGYPEGAIAVIGTVELLCAVIYLVPLTSVLGAVLLTGYLGGAVATHVRAGEPFAIPVVVGVLVWAGLFLRDERIRALLPLKRG
ncbi:MAG: DoxX family protein [Polyangiales bacterium]